MNARTGYSLLEVLVAFAIMSATLAVLVPGQTQLLVRATDANKKALAHDLALSHLDEALVLSVAPEVSYRDWRIETAVTATSFGQLISVTVHSAGGQVLAKAQREVAISDAK